MLRHTTFRFAFIAYSLLHEWRRRRQAFTPKKSVHDGVGGIAEEHRPPACRDAIFA